MAVTVHSGAHQRNINPAFNEQWFVATSNQTSQPNFKYTIILTDLISGASITEQVEPNPSGKLEFDASYFVQKYITNFIPVNSYGWKKCVDSTRNIRVNIGETYGATPAYYAGTNLPCVTWNAALDLRTFASYNLNDYCYDSSIPNFAYLTAIGTLNTYSDRSNLLYVLIKEGRTVDLPNITVKSYNSGGALLGTSVIARPDSTTGLYTDNYVCIDIGRKGLDGLTTGQVTGAFPVLPANTDYYTISDLNSGGGSNGVIATVYIKCSPRHTVYSLHYLNSKGGFDTLHCNLVSELTSDKQTYTAKKNTWTNSSNVMTMNVNTPIEKIQSVVINDKIKVNSDWLTEAGFTRHKDLFSSPLVLLDLGSGQNYIPVQITDNTYVQRNSERLRNLTFNLKYTHSNYRQRG